MTKPSYEELEIKVADSVMAVAEAQGLKELAYEQVDKYWKRVETVEAELNAKAKELTRVRGLLQRQWISVEERLPPQDTNVFVACYSMNGKWAEVAFLSGERWVGVAGGVRVRFWQPIPAPPNFPQSSSPVPHGAESADIGKLDTADKSGKVNRLDEKKACAERHAGVRGQTVSPTNAGTARQSGAHVLIDGRGDAVTMGAEGHGETLTAPPLRNERPSVEISGSAETGGEKAADLPEDTHPLAARLRRMADHVPPDFNTNDDLRDGYYAGVFDAAAELDIALSESREPEKLNNAHQLCVCGHFSGLHEPGAAIANYRFCKICPDCTQFRLAESSLSSPPPSQHYLSVERRKEAVWDAVRLADHAYDDATVDSQGMTRPEYIGKAATEAFYADYGASSPELLPTQLPKEK